MNVVTDSKVPSYNQLGFMAALPSDIVTEVFGNISQQDCLTCMAVCRDWYNLVPEYAQGLWKELQLSVRNVNQNHQRRQRCLGNHVKRVSLRALWTENEKVMCTSLKRLVALGCTKIEKLELSYWRITDAFVDTLKQIGSHLIHITLEAGRFSIPLPYVLSACPVLTHFTVQGCNVVRKSEAYYQALRALLSMADHHPNIAYLYMDIAMEQEQFERILKMCPNLRYLITGYSTTRDIFDNLTNNIDLYSISSRCPKITSISINCFADPLYPYQDFDDYTKYPASGLRYLSIFNCSRFANLDRHLMRSQETLEWLSLSDTAPGSSGSSMLNSISLPNLRGLACNFCNFGVDSFVAILNHCPVIEKLYLNRECELSLNSTVIQSLNTLPHLQKLSWASTGVTLANGLSLLTVLERLPALEELEIHGEIPLMVSKHFQPPKQLKTLSLDHATWKRNSNDNVDPDTEVAHFLKCLTLDSKLKTLHLLEREALGIKSLEIVASIQTLKALSVTISPTVYDYELLRVITMLKNIESLTFPDIEKPCLALVDGLSKLPRLRKLTLRSSQIPAIQMDKEILLHMLRKCSKLVEVELCPVQVENGAEALSGDAIEELILNESLRRCVVGVVKSALGFCQERPMYFLTVRWSP